MTGLTFKTEVSIGDILTIVSIAITVIALVVSWNKDRELKRREYADKIRRAASLIAAKLERWKELNLRFFEDIQPLITESDTILVKEQNIVSTRDHLWQGFVAARAKSSQRIIDEQIETAYADLYGYEPKIRALYIEVLDRLKLIDQGNYEQLLYLTQADVLKLQVTEKPFFSAQLGNELRNTCRSIAVQFERLMNEVIAPFDREMTQLIEGSDQSIVGKRIKIRSRKELYPKALDELGEALKLQVEMSRSMSRMFAVNAPKVLHQRSIEIDTALQAVLKASDQWAAACETGLYNRLDPRLSPSLLDNLDHLAKPTILLTGRDTGQIDQSSDTVDSPPSSVQRLPHSQPVSKSFDLNALPSKNKKNRKRW